MLGSVDCYCCGQCETESLRAIFPHLSENDARSAVTNYGSVDRAADALSANDPIEVA